MTNVERAKAMFQAINQRSQGRGYPEATKKLLNELVEAVKDREAGFDWVWEKENRQLGLSPGNHVVFLVAAAGEAIVMIVKTLGAQQPMVAVDGITYDVETAEWVGPHDEDRVGLPGERVPRIPASVVVAQFIADKIAEMQSEQPQQ